MINELIDEKVKIKEGKKFGVDPSSSDIEQSYAAMSSRMRITPDQLTKSLESQGIRADTLKARLKADMVWTSLVRGRFKESLVVGEKDVATAATGRRRKDRNRGLRIQDAADRPDRAARIGAGRNRSATQGSRGPARARAELRGSQFLFQVDEERRDPRDRTKTSADIPGPLREVLDKTPIGHLTAPEITKQGVEMVALCGRKPTTVDTPKKREIRDKMYAAEIRGEVESLPAGCPQSRDDRISLSAWQSPSR